MDNLSVGRKIAEARKAKGYSQDQLAIILNVTYQAVSKWETGKAVPKRSVCDRLSGLLGFDVGGYIDDNLTPDEAEEIVIRQKEALWKKAEKRMHELYGEEVPLRIMNRFIRERNILRRGKSVILFDVLARVQEAARKKPARFDAPGAECFVAWLLGATDVNPLEPHLRCPKCHRVEFHPEVQSGWDLKDQLCECGGRMEPDGQDVPVETCILGDGDLYEYFRCPVDIDFLGEAEKIILTYGEQFFNMEIFREEEDDDFMRGPEGQIITDPETGKKIPVHYLPFSVLMFRPKKKAAPRKLSKISGPTDIENWGRRAGLPVISLQGGFIEPSYLSLPSPFRSSPDELVRQDIMERALRDYWDHWSVVLEDRTNLKFPDLNTWKGKLTFGKYVSLICSVNNLYMTSGPEELAEKCGFADMTDMPLSFEDLWASILKSTAYPDYMSGPICEILFKARNGQYLSGRDYLHGIPPRDKKMIRELNFPDWFETYASNVFCLCWRTPYIHMGIQLLEDARRKIREGK